jgi:hypothetical protein
MKLKLINRISLPSLFPQKSSFEKLIILNDIQNKIKLTQEEVTKFEVKSSDTSITWNDNGSKAEFDIDFTESESNLIADLLKTLSKEESLTLETLELYKLFVK